MRYSIADSSALLGLIARRWAFQLHARAVESGIAHRRYLILPGYATTSRHAKHFGICRIAHNRPTVRATSTTRTTATAAHAKYANHFTGNMAGFGANGTSNSECVEIESGVDLACFWCVAIRDDRARSMLTINVQQRRNQSAVIIRGKWLAVRVKLAVLLVGMYGGSQ